MEPDSSCLPQWKRKGEFEIKERTNPIPETKGKEIEEQGNDTILELNLQTQEGNY